jgi:O-antigen ligase
MSMHSETYIRLRSLISADFLLPTLAATASVAIGAMVAKSPTDAVALVVVCIAIAVALTRPMLLFAAGIVLLAIEPARIFGEGSTAGRPETFKLVLYACTLPLLFSRGVDRRKCAPLVAYGLVTILTELFGTRLPGLTSSQTAASLATLCLGWLVFAINWDWRRDRRLLEVLIWVPTLSVLAGLVLQQMGILLLLGHSSPHRLEGATIAPWLAAFSLYSVIACLVLYRREKWRWARWLGCVNVLILGTTLTRGAVLALGIVAIPPLIRFYRHQLSVKNIAGIAKLGTAAIVAIIGSAILVSGLQERTENARVLVNGQGVHEIASGRFRAWAFAYEQAEVNLAFGRGVGAGPVVGKSPGSPAGFSAQHNEYLRMLLEVGIVGGIILLMTIITTMVSLIRRAPLPIRADLAAAGVAFAIYSITENTLTATPLAVAFLLVFSISGSRATLSPLTPSNP